MNRKRIEHPIFGHLGKKIKFIRILQGIKQKDMADEMGVSQQSISSIEKTGIIDADRLKAVAKVLGVTPGFILNTGDLAVNYFRTPVDPIKEPEPKVDETVNKIVDLYERLLEVEKEKIAYLENLLEKFTLKEIPKPYRTMRTV